MSWNKIRIIALTLPVIIGTRCLESQVANAATESRIPLTVGIGGSDYFIDWGHSRMMGGVTAWADWRLRGLPSPLKGLAITIEGHHIDYFRPAGVSRMRQDSGLGGISYQFSKWDRVRPYGRYLVGFGAIYFPDISAGYNHDTRTILAPGGGLDIHVWRKLSIRVDYEYQFWRQIFGPRDLTPNGLTVGAVWDFGRDRQPQLLPVQ